MKLAPREEQARSGGMSAAVASLRDRSPRPISEREILRVVSTIPHDEQEDILTAARSEVLKWACKRAGGDVPEGAWQGDAFEVLAAGRTTMSACVQTEGGLVWSLRGDDPDKHVPGRIWSTEVSLGRLRQNEDVLLGVRLLVNSTETQLEIEPSVPGLVVQIAERCGLQDGPVQTRSTPHYAETEEHADLLLDWLLSGARRLPIIVASGDERSDVPDRPFIDVELLSKALCGLAHVVSLPAKLTYKVSDLLGKALTVFHGGVRIYNPGFDIFADARDHRLYLGNTLVANPEVIVAEIRKLIARESLRRTRLGHHVLPFAAVRSAAMRIRQSEKMAEGASDADQLSAANARSEALELELEGLRAEADQALDLSLKEASRAEDAEKQLASAWARIEHLEVALGSAGAAAKAEEPDPAEWDQFADWCDRRFSGRLSLAPAARRGVRKPIFEDVALTANCVRWLATEARERFLSGGGSLANIPVFDGVTNAPCGADEYDFDFQGRRLLAKWHLKNGGNTRQPERCLRIYYAVDEVTRQIVISDMPAHRRTGAS